MKLNFRQSEPLVAHVGDVLFIDNITYALVIKANKKNFEFLNITQPDKISQVSGVASYNQIKTMQYIGSLMCSRIELLTLNCNTDARPMLTADPTSKDYMGAIVINKRNELLLIINVLEHSYQVMDLATHKVYYHSCIALGGLSVLAKYSDYTLHFED